MGALPRWRSGHRWVLTRVYTLLTATNPAFTLIRAPSRIGVVVAFALSVPAGLSISALLARLAGPAARSRRTLAIVAASLAGAAVAELKVPLTFSRRDAPEPAYRALAALPRGPVIEIPFYSTRFAAERTRTCWPYHALDAARQRVQLAHSAGCRGKHTDAGRVPEPRGVPDPQT